MEQERVATSDMEAWEDQWGAIDDGADVADARGVEDRMDDVGIVGSKLREPPNPGSLCPPADRIAHLPPPLRWLRVQACHTTSHRSPSVAGVAPSFSLASWNVHCGVDGWGRPFDVGALGADLGADIVLVQESWRPSSGLSSAGKIAEAMGAELVETVLAPGRRGRPHQDAGPTWHQPGSTFGGDHSLYLDPPSASTQRSNPPARYDEAEPGDWCIAIVSKLPVVNVRTFPLGQLRRDAANRKLLVVDAVIDGRPVTVATAHLAHLTQGSHRQFRALRHTLRGLGGPRSATVAGGDMNCWGPLVSLQVPRWRRAVRGPTWPAWRPHSQLDHLLVGGGLRVVSGEVVEETASDHLPIRVVLELGGD